MILLGLSGSLSAVERTTTLRFWQYQSVSKSLTKSVGLWAMIGSRHEVIKRVNSEKSDINPYYMTELFFGPTFRKQLGKHLLYMPMAYYYIDYPMTDNPQNVKKVITHNINPIFLLISPLGKGMSMQNRLVFFGTFYTDFYSKFAGYPEKDNFGFSLMATYKFQLTLPGNGKIKPIFANETFWGVMGDDHVKPAIAGIGFTDKGYLWSRTYAGISWKINPRVIAEPQIIMDNDNHKSPHTAHLYFHVTMRYYL